VLLSPRLRKTALVAHVAASVGWLGAVVVFLALAIAANTNDDADTVRGAYITMQLIGATTLAPLSLLSLATGLIQSFGTTWGLLRHYWVIVKVAITVVATGVLLAYLQTLDYLADRARADVGVSQLRDPSPMLHSSAALVLLVIATVLSVFKPRGLTRYGWRQSQDRLRGAR
jgi:hypothetical protein